jgi:DNA-binding NarL/FixJ family response regulator
VEDNDAMRNGLEMILNGSPGFVCGGAFRQAEEALERIPPNPPDVILMDINLPGMSGIEGVVRMRERLPNALILMLTIEADSEVVFRSLEAGASGYLVKNTPPAEILDAIREVHRGGSPMSSEIARLVVRSFQRRGQSRREQENLTAREQEVLHLVARGYRSKEVAQSLGLSVQTIEAHLRNIYVKLHVRSRTEAVAKFYQRDR